MPMNYGEVSRATFARIAVEVGVGYLVVAALIVAHTIRKFDRIVGRARQTDWDVTNGRPGGFPVVTRAPRI